MVIGLLIGGLVFGIVFAVLIARGIVNLSAQILSPINGMGRNNHCVLHAVAVEN